LFSDDELGDEDIEDYLNMVNAEDVDTNRINAMIAGSGNTENINLG
jgi:hypothetical protein